VNPAPGPSKATRKEAPLAAPARFPVGTEVDLYHVQSKEWRRGVVFSVGEECEDCWKKAPGWQGERWNGKVYEAIGVQDVMTGGVLYWDDNCKARLPKPLWGWVKLAESDCPPIPATVAQGRQFRELEVRGVLTQPERKDKSGADKEVEVPGQARTNTAALALAIGNQDAAGANALDRRLASDAHELYTQALASHPGEQGSASQALASAAGRVAALDAGVTLYLRKAGLEESTPQPKSALDLCRPTVGIDAIEEYRHMPPFLKTFLWEFASVEYQPPDCRGVCGTALQRRASDARTIEARARALLPVFGILFGTHGSYADLRSLSSWHRHFAVMLLIADDGLSEKAMKEVSNAVGSGSAPAARRDIHAASKELTAREVLTGGLTGVLEKYKPAADETPAMVHTVDNANKVVDHKEYAKLGCGVTMSGINLTRGDRQTIEQEFKNMPKPNATTVGEAALTDADQAVLDKTALVRDMLALRSAAKSHLTAVAAGGADPQAAAAPDPAPDPLPVDTAISFRTDLGHVHEGRVSAVCGGDRVTVVYQHGNGEEERRTLPVRKCQRIGSQQPAAATTDSPAGDSTAASGVDVDRDPAAKKARREAQLEQDAESLEIECELGNRSLTYPNSTWLYNILHHSSSKHHAAAQEAMAAMHAACEEPLLVASLDHEFYPDAVQNFFLSGDKSIVNPAYGHEAKALASGTLKFHELLWTKRFLEARKITPGSSGYARMLNGSRIRETIQHAIMEDSALREALAKRFLATHPELIEVFVSAVDAGEARSATTLDAFGRSQTFLYTDSMAAAAKRLRAEVELAVGGGSGLPALLCDSVEALRAAANANTFGCDASTVNDVERRLREMPATKRAGGAPSIAMHMDSAEIERAGLKTIVQKRYVLRAYYLSGLGKLSSAEALLPCLSGGQCLGRFRNDDAHAEGLEQAKAAVAVATSPAASTQKLPPAPEGSNINMKILADHLYKLMPGFLLLHQHTRIRKAKPLEDMERRLSERCDACNAVGREFCTCSDLTSALQAGSRDADFRDARDAVVVAMAVVVLAATSRAGADSDSDEDEDVEDVEDGQAGRAAQRDGFGD